MTNWQKIDNRCTEDSADGAELMIVTGISGKYLLCKMRKHPALPAVWSMAIRILPTDTRETLEADAGRNCPMTVWYCAMGGFDNDRPLMIDWPEELIHDIATSATTHSNIF